MHSLKQVVFTVAVTVIGLTLGLLATEGAAVRPNDPLVVPVRVTNVGTGPASGVVLSVITPDGVKARSEPVVANELAAGGSERLELIFDVQEAAGAIRIDVGVDADNAPDGSVDVGFRILGQVPDEEPFNWLPIVIAFVLLNGIIFGAIAIARR